jgi:hypothetical protein
MRAKCRGADRRGNGNPGVLCLTLLGSSGASVSREIAIAFGAAFSTRAGPHSDGTVHVPLFALDIFEPGPTSRAQAVSRLLDTAQAAVSQISQGGPVGLPKAVIPSTSGIDAMGHKRL